MQMSWGLAEASLEWGICTTQGHDLMHRTKPCCSSQKLYKPGPCILIRLQAAQPQVPVLLNSQLTSPVRSSMRLEWYSLGMLESASRLLHRLPTGPLAL